MTEFAGSWVRDGRGGQIRFPVFITQADLDLIEREFVVQDDDVFITTFPRCGTTWTEQIVHLLVNGGVQGEQRLTDAVPWVETLPQRPNGMAAFLKTLRGRRLFTSHLPYPLMPRLDSTSAKVVYVARNPKDVATSLYFHDQSKAGYEGTWEEHLHLFLKGDLHFGDYFDHVLSWWETSQRNGNVLFMKFEDMKRDHANSVAQIASFLHVPATPDLIATVVTQSGFRAMTSAPNTNFDWVPQRADVPGHFRKGDVGDWRNHFTAEQSRKMDTLIMERLGGAGLAFDFGD